MPPPRVARLPAANKIFVGRKAEQRLFEDAAFAIPADRSTVLVFYGAGGQGKTSLCRELMHCTGAGVDPSYGFLRRAELDLHGRAKEDPDRLLVWIRNGFADAGVVFPCFDLAFAIAWEATRGEEPLPKFTKQWLKRATEFGNAGTDKAASLAGEWVKSADAKELIGDLAGNIPGVGFILKRIGHWAIEKGKRLFLERTKDALKELYRDGELKKPYELSALLPWMLAQDFNAHLAAKPTERFILFVDEYERVFDEGGAGSISKEVPFDSRLRTLICETNGMLVTFFSREQMQWRNSWRDDLEGRQHLIGGLTALDADTFLRAIPIDAGALRASMIAGARETAQSDALVYPLMLDLQVEHWRHLVASGTALSGDLFRVAAEGFKERRQEVVDRVLRDYGLPLQTTLERLSVGRRFDREAFTHVVETFGTALPLDQFDRIANLSFVTRGADGFLAIHSTIAEIMRETLQPEKRATSIEVLFRHFAQRATSGAISEVTDKTAAALVEAAYLRAAQGSEGYVAWLADADDAVSAAGRYASVAGLWREAESIANTELGPDHPDTALSLSTLGNLLRGQGDLGGARNLFERAVAIQEKTLGADDLHTMASLNGLALVLHSLGDLPAARPLFERSLEHCEKALGAAHVNTATCLNNLALLLQTQGDLAGARPLGERALSIYEQVLDPDHPTIAAGLTNLAGLIEAQGDLAGARPLYERALAIRERVFGADHPDTAVVRNNLSRVLQSQGDFAGARAILERVLSIHETALGADHPYTATSLNNLASLLQAQGNYASAKPLFERALAIRERVLGPVHHETAASLNNLAALLRAQGDLAGARPHFERALTIHRQVLGADHPDTAVMMANLASLLQAQGHLLEARQLFERALSIHQEALGSDHPHTATSLNNLAYLFLTERDFRAAGPLFERALAIREKVLGPDHVSTATSLNNLALLLQAQSNLDGARLLFERALAIRERTLGPDHPDTASSLFSMAQILRVQGDSGGAGPLFERALAIREKALGPYHLDTAASALDLAGFLQTQGGLARARPLLERALSIYEKVLGPDHTDTATSLNNLGVLLLALDDLAGARRLFRRALAVYEKVLGPNHPNTTTVRANLTKLPRL